MVVGVAGGGGGLWGDELAAGALILYPAYVSRETGCFTTPERALDEMLAWRAQCGNGLPWWRKAMRRVLRLSDPNLGLIASTMMRLKL